MKILYLFITVVTFSFLISPAYSQLYRLQRKIENKAEDAAVDAIFGKKKDKNASSDDEDNSDGSSNSGRNRAQNKGGAGLMMTPPDVKKHLEEADASFKSSSYSKARTSLQLAMQGVELEIGQSILKSLPESINGLNKEASADQVTSTGWGWAGLTIQRLYTDGQDKELQVVVANNSGLLSATNLYLAGNYSQTTGDQQNWKKTTVKGHNAVISYDEYDGYKINIPIGQTSVLIFEGINFNDENDIMKAASTVDIDDIKKKLGEQ